jgi:integrase
MNKTLLRHKTRLHPLFKYGETEITRACSEDTNTQKRLINQWLNFCTWSITKDGDQIETIISVTREQIIRYGQYLKSEFDNGRFASTSSATSYLSGINTVMKLIHADWGKVSAVKECGLEPLSHIPNKKPELDKNGLPDIENLAGYLLELQSALGVVIREALSLDLKEALIEGRSTGFVTITNLQNGVRRKVPCRSSAIKAIGKGIAARQLQKLLPKKREFDHFLAAHNKLAARKGYSTNTARGVYIRERYQEITGIEPPIISDHDLTDHLEKLAQFSNKTLSEAKGMDKNARHVIAKEIGVLGIELLKDYLDKKI